MIDVSSRPHSNGAKTGRRGHGLLVAAMAVAVIAAIVASAFLFVPQAAAPELTGGFAAAR